MAARNSKKRKRSLLPDLGYLRDRRAAANASVSSLIASCEAISALDLDAESATRSGITEDQWIAWLVLKYDNYSIMCFAVFCTSICV